jgi:hypothetical protein
MANVFNKYGVNGKLKFFKNDSDDKLTISIGISSNHQMNENILDDINKFLEKLLIEDYITEDMHQSIMLHKKIVKDNHKQSEKLAKKAMKKTTKKVIKKVVFNC